jgi:hypothetical protein
LHVHCRVADLADAVHDPAERTREPPGVERPPRVVEILDVPRRDARRGWTSRSGKGDLVLDQDAAPGDEDLRDAETELGMAPGQGYLFAVPHDDGEEIPPFSVPRQVDSRVPRRRDP